MRYERFYTISGEVRRERERQRKQKMLFDFGDSSSQSACKQNSGILVEIRKCTRDTVWLDVERKLKHFKYFHAGVCRNIISATK